MRYYALLKSEGKDTLAEFPGCPGCQTFAGPGESIQDQAKDALEGWLQAHLVEDESPPRPKRCPRRGRVLAVEVSPGLAIKLVLRWAREAAGWSRAKLASRAGVSLAQIEKIEHPDANPTLNAVERVASALGMRIEVASPIAG